ncbi:MAG: cyclic-di-AMP receptor [Anaerolineae bacterium]
MATPPAPITKLVVAIIHRDDAPGLVQALNKRGFSATVISTTGGFLREGNSTALIGTSEANLTEVLRIVKDNAHTRSRYVNSVPPVVDPGELYMAQPVEVEVGGAVTFVLEVERFDRY